MRFASERAGRPGWLRGASGIRELICCASPAYLEAHGEPQHPDDLLRHQCLEYTYLPASSAWTFEDREGRRHPVRISSRVRANNGRMLTALAVAGLGVVLEPDFIVAPEIRAGRLRPLLPQFAPPRTPISAVYPSRRHLSPKVRAFVDFLADRFAAVGTVEPVSDAALRIFSRVWLRRVMSRSGQS